MSGVWEGYSKRSPGFKSSHNTTSKQNTVERHTRMRKLERPLSRKIRFRIIRATETTSRNENNVRATTKSRVHAQHGRMEIFVRVVTACSSSGPLTNEGEGGVCFCDGDDTAEGFC